MKILWEKRYHMVRDWLPKGGVGIELGVARGNFSKVLLEHARPRKLHLVDLWTGCPYTTEAERERDWQKVQESRRREVYRKMAYLVEKGKVQIHEMSTLDAAPLFPDGHFDWVFVDADHTYEGCLADADAYLPKLRVGGYMMFHDYLDRPRYGVVRAVDELAQRDCFEVVGQTREPTSPTAILRKTSEADR
jgi:hypothetical protein